MSPAKVVAIAAIAALVFWGSTARASTLPIVDDTLPEPDPFWPDWPDPIHPETDQPMPDVIDVEIQRLRAFIYMIECAETTPRDVESGRAFRVFYGDSEFFDLSDHPVATGEKTGVRLPDTMCRAAGFSPGCVSTAAGAGQIILPTWRTARAAGAWGSRLPDFSPASQEEAIRRILIMCGAYPHVLAGDFDAAIRAASTQWASLPYSSAGQNPKQFERVFALYKSALGVA